MACFHPRTVYRPIDGGKLFFTEKPDCREISIPCRKCHGCRVDRSQEWAVRCLAEAQMFGVARCFFVTVTYDEDNNPISLVKRDHVLFMKRLRKEFGSVRFYMCGEYGEKSAAFSPFGFGRPHFHYLWFGIDIPDLNVWRNGDRFREYTSPTVDKLWGKGRVILGHVTLESAQYVAGYIHKKRLGKDSKEFYRRVDVDTGEVMEFEPEFGLMSRRPGIGDGWFKKFHADVFPRDGVILAGGRRVRPPRFYDEKFKAMIAKGEADADAFDLILAERVKRAEAIAASGESSRERLETREFCAVKRSEFFSGKQL